MAMRLGVVSSICSTLLALAAGNVAGAGRLLHAAPATYLDAVGDAGDAPDIARVTIRPEGNGFAVDVELAEPTDLGRYGWILFGVDTDRNPFTGGGRGDELVVFTNGESTTLERWIGGRFTPNFVHHDVEAAFSGTDLTFVLARSDLRTRSFDFAVASLRQQADLAPGGGVARYPRRNSGGHQDARVSRASV
jgi:hypothetical protein